jgi:multiple sugar transport system substrate-binding protein
MKAGEVLPLTDTISTYGIDTDAMNAVALSECELEGELYCLGSLTGSVTLVYNKDLLDDAGVAYPSPEQPWTIDEFADAAREISENLDGVWGATAEVPVTWMDRRTHFSDDGTTIEGEADDDATVHVYDVLTDLVKDDAAPPPAETELATGADMLAAGRVAMAITDTEYAAASLVQAGARWGAAPPPVEEAGDAPFVFVGTDKYGAFTDSKNPETAKALVAYIATEGNRLRVEVSDKPPLDSRLLPEWAGDDEGRQETVKVVSLRSNPGLFVPGFWEVTAPLFDYYAQMANGDISPRDALTEQAPLMQEKLDREWQTWEEIE